MLLAGVRARREAAASELPALLGELDAERVFDRLARHRLLPLLGVRLASLAGEAVDPGQASRASRSLQDARQNSLAKELVSLRLTRTLDHGGVRVAILKGPFFARELHGDPGARVSNDIDLLVAPGQFERAVAVLGSIGHVTTDGPAMAEELPLFEASLRPAEGGPAVDLHWRLHWYERAFSQQALARAERDPADGIIRLRPHDAFVTLLLGYVRDGFWGLRPLVDIAAWWDKYGHTLEPAGLQPVIDADPDLGPCLRASAHVVSRFAGVPLERLLPASATLSRAEGLACELAGWDEQMSSVRFRSACALIDVLLAPAGGRAAAVARYYAPPLRTVLNARSSLRPPGAAARVSARARYAARVALRYGPEELRLLVHARRRRIDARASPAAARSR